MTLQEQFVKLLSAKKSLVKRRAEGYIKHDYLVPNGVYEEQWDWDAFFIGMALASAIPSEAVYLKNMCLNYLEHMRPNGFTPGLLTRYGIDKRLRHIKPFLAQSAFYASRFLRDFSWIKPHYPKLQKILAHRQRTYLDRKTGLVCWYNGMESGADNNPAVLFYKDGTSLAVDLNTLLYLEYKAMALIAGELKMPRERKIYKTKARNLRFAIRKYLWDKSDFMFYNRDRISQKPIKRIPHSSLVGLWADLLTPAEAKRMIRKYVLNPKKMLSRFGVRSLAKDDPNYNNVNILKPHSNWQGPIWVNFNYMMVQVLTHYGFAKAARKIAEAVVKVCLNDLQKNRMMHENYDAETGKPLAAPDFVSWNLLAELLIPLSQTGKSEFVVNFAKV